MLQSLQLGQRVCRWRGIDKPQRLKTAVAEQRNIAKPAQWQDFAYPFVYGQFDASLMPLTDWRAASQQSFRSASVRQWSQDHVDRDDPGLISQIQHRLLPARGIMAQRDQILVTSGAQMACYLLAQVLMDSPTVVGVEDPGYPDARNNFALRSASVKPLAIDEHGLVPSRRLGQCDYVYVTPSHQCPTSVTMPLSRRQALLDLANTQGVAAMARTWAQGMVHPERLRDSALMEAIVAMFARKTPHHFACQIRALLSRPNATHTLQNIAGPVHLICGAQDTWSPVSQHQAMARELSQPVLQVIADAGHMAPMEKPEAVAQVLLAWLASEPLTPAAA